MLRDVSGPIVIESAHIGGKTEAIFTANLVEALELTEATIRIEGARLAAYRLDPPLTAEVTLPSAKNPDFSARLNTPEPLDMHVG